MKLLERDIPVVYLKPGELYFAERPTTVVTVLGSCLSVTMFSPRKKFGVICHGLLPQCGGKGSCNDDCLNAFKYVDCSIMQMLKLFDQSGVKRNEIEVKFFGGSDIFTKEIDRPGIVSVGRQNIETAKAILVQEGIKAVSMDVGGLRGRKIFFYTDTGEVLLKRLSRADDKDILW